MAAAAAVAAPAPAAAAADFATFAATRLWVDVRDGNHIWWPAELIGGPKNDELQVKLARKPNADPNELVTWVEKS